MEFPKNLPDFDRLFPDNEACLAFLEWVRWGKSFGCQKCGHDRYWQTATGLRQCRACEFKNSVKTNSIFEKSKLGLKMWFYAIWWITSQKNGVSALSLQRFLGIGSYETSWLLLHKIRSAMIFSDRSLLNGDIEVDEAFLGGIRTGKRGRGADGKQLIVIAAEFSGSKKIGRIRIQRSPDASAESLEAFIKKNTAPKSTIHTDGWRGYNGVAGLGYEHKPQKSGLVDPDELLPRINIVTALLKRWILGTHQGRMDLKHMDSYLEEFVFRFNRRTSKVRGLLFQRVIENSFNTDPSPYDKVTSRKS
jgi:transposase-like protein